MNHRKRYLMLDAEHEHTITNNGNVEGISEEGDENGVPIRLKIRCQILLNEGGFGRTVDAVLDNRPEWFTYEPVDAENPQFLHDFRKILRGESKNWKLISATVQQNFIWLSFFSTKITDEESIGDTEHICFQLPKDTSENDYIRFEFEISSANNTSQKVNVWFRSGKTYIEEVCLHLHRVYSLPGETVGWDKRFQLVGVEESYF